MKKKLLASAFTASMFFTSCEDLAEMNVDPNEPTEVPAQFLVTQAQYGLVENYWGRPLNFGFGMLMVQHFAETEYTDASRYNYTAPDFDGAFTGFYSSADGSLSEIAEARRLIEVAEGIPEAQKANQLAVLEIMKAWAFHVATDIWGGVPYLQAHKPDEFTKPAYDGQDDIYPELLATLANASSAIDAGSPGFSEGDLIYGGDMGKWKKFANSLRVKIAMRMADADEAAASAEITAAMNEGVFESNADHAFMVFEENAQLANPFWVDNVTDNRDDFAVSALLVDHLKANNDPRLMQYANPNEDGEYIGLTYGLVDNDATSASVGKSRPNGTYVRGAAAPGILMSYAELKFFETEAIARGFIAGDAAASFEEAIRASMARWDVTDQAAIDAYVADHGFDSYPNYKEAVGMEKWVSLYTNGLEAWAEWRRLDVPALSLPDIDAGQLFSDQIPVRALYPQSEAARNKENLGAVISAEGEDQLTRKLWWDVN